MSKHTPGPWVVCNTDPLMFGAKRGNGSEPLGFVYGPAFAERSGVGQCALANCRLISAAPELYEALEASEERDEAMHAYDDLQCFVDDPETCDEYLAEYRRRTRQRAALSKARGKS